MKSNRCQFPTLQVAETISTFTPSVAFTKRYVDGYRSPVCAGVYASWKWVTAQKIPPSVNTRSYIIFAQENVWFTAGRIYRLFHEKEATKVYLFTPTTFNIPSWIFALLGCYGEQTDGKRKLAQDVEFYQLRYIEPKAASSVVFMLLPGTNFRMEHAVELIKFLILNLFTTFYFQTPIVLPRSLRRHSFLPITSAHRCFLSGLYTWHALLNRPISIFCKCQLSISLNVVKKPLREKLICFKDPVLTVQEILSLSAIKNNCLILYETKVAVYSEIPKNTQIHSVGSTSN